MIQEIIQSDVFMQSIGFIAMFFSLAIYQFNDQTKMIKLAAASSFFFFIHLYLIGGGSGAIVSLVSLVRNLLFIKYRKNKNAVFLPYLFIIIFFCIGLMSFEGWVGFLPVMATSLNTISYWKNKPKIVRLVALLATPLWFVYGIIQGSYATILNESVLFLSAVIGFIRYDTKKKKSKYFKLFSLIINKK